MPTFIYGEIKITMIFKEKNAKYQKEKQNELY